MTSGRGIKKSSPDKSEELLIYRDLLKAAYSLIFLRLPEVEFGTFSRLRGRVVKTSQGQFPQSFWIRMILKNEQQNNAVYLRFPKILKFSFFLVFWNRSNGNYIKL